MANGFKREEVESLLVKCHRRCCICHRFCGTKIETDHIEQRADTENDAIENAIAVCFECHAEIHSYNDKHPRGRKFRPEELRQHRDQWLKICAEKPEVMLAAAWDGDVGPLQALIDELEFNRMVVQCSQTQGSKDENRGALFQDAQFLRAIKEGMVAILEDALKISVLRAYAAISRANQRVLAEVNQDLRREADGANARRAREAVKHAEPLINAAYEELVRFLRTDANSA